MSTRRLIIAAMLCGMAILVAFAVQVLLARDGRGIKQRLRLRGRRRRQREEGGVVDRGIVGREGVARMAGDAGDSMLRAGAAVLEPR